MDPDAFEDPLSNYEPPVYASELHRVLAEQPVSTIQAHPWIQVSAATSIEEAIRALNDSNVSSLLVVEGEKLVGIFTERDVLENVAKHLDNLSTTPVHEVMTTDPLVVYESDPVGTAVAAIAVAGHRHVPVLKIDGTVNGIVSPRRVLSCLEAYIGESSPKEES
jgi:signal-transduction protein with cAMP-binding, CBS, and nucleotidyltransferase domain